jgi:AAA domain
VLVVDEAGMLGSRKLARLLEHAQQARAKVVLVGDDRQLSAIDAGGGFRALRHRLGVSELTENRRQHQAWEREALELVRGGLVEEAVAAYRAHDRVVCAESKPAATLALLRDWWPAYREAERDPAQDVIVLAGRRAEVDRLNVACQQLLADRGRLGSDRLQVEDLQLAVGDRVVCGRNAIDQVVRELAWQRRARGLVAEHEAPGYLRQELGPVPESTRGRRVWRQAAAAIEDYRRSHQITDPDRALGGVPHDPGQRAAWQHTRQAIARVQGRQRHPDRDRQPQRGPASRPSQVDRYQQDQPPSHPGRDAQPRRSGLQRAAG